MLLVACTTTGPPALGPSAAWRCRRPARRSARQRRAAPAAAGGLAARVRRRLAPSDRDGTVRPGTSSRHRSRTSRATGRRRAPDRAGSARRSRPEAAGTGTSIGRSSSWRCATTCRCWPPTCRTPTPRGSCAAATPRSSARRRSRRSVSTFRSRPKCRRPRNARSTSATATRCRRSMWPRMAQAQFARDAVMAEVLRRSAPQGGGVVLLAGNGHVRRDIGVPRWLGMRGRDCSRSATSRSPTTRRRSRPSTRWCEPRRPNAPIRARTSKGRVADK